MPPGAPQPSAAVRDEATTHLTRLVSGDTSARERLFVMVLADLRSLASRFLRGERPGHTLQPTALVNEAWLRLIREKEVELNGRGHFLALAARAMRQILVEHAKARNSEKRGGGRQRVDWVEDPPAPSPGAELDLLVLDRALERLKKRSEYLAQLVELRFFAGLAREEVAEALGVSNAKVGRDWRAARGLLSKYMLEEEEAAG